MAKRRPARQRVWMLMPTAADVEALRTRIAARGPSWDRWTYKLHRDRILIYDATGTYDPVAKQYDPTRTEPRLHLRVSPCPAGPFELEWMRHTGQWWPLHVTGTAEQIGDAIATGRVPMTHPLDQH